MNKLTPLVALAAAALITAGCGSNSDSGGGGTASSGSGTTNLKIGFSAALSGGYASVDQPLLNGMNFAVKQINAGQGPKGVHVEVVSQDNRGEQTLTATTTQEMLDSGIKTFVLTTADSSVAQGQLISQAGGISAMGTNTSPQLLTDIGDRTFMLVYGDNVQAAAAAQEACKKGYQTAYTYASPEVPYTRDLPVFFAEAFAATCGGKVVGKDTYKIGGSDYGAQVTKFRGSGSHADVIYTPMWVPDLGAFLKGLRSNGDKTPVISADGADTSLLVDSGGSAVDGLMFTTHAFARNGNAMATFIEQFTKATGKKPESSTFEAIGRDTIYALAEAASEAKSADPNAILEKVLAFRGLDLLTGKLDMDPQTRIPRKPVTLIQMQGSKFSYVTDFVPDHIPAPVGAK